jgi:ATP-dependent RNA helicase DDX49/DBP8
MSSLFGKRKKKRQRSEIADPKPSGLMVHDDTTTPSTSQKPSKHEINNDIARFEDLGLADPLASTCRSLGFVRPTPVQRAMIPFLISDTRTPCLALAATGTGKTAAYVLPILHHLSVDPYGIFAVVLTPTRELAQQIHQQVLALGSAYTCTSTLVVGGLDSVRQSCRIDALRPHFVVATPGRFATLLRNPQPPNISNARYLVLDEADRLLARGSGFERDIAEVLIHTNNPERKIKCQTLLFSATWTASLKIVEELANEQEFQKFVIDPEPREGTKSDEKVQAKDSKDIVSDEINDPHNGASDEGDDIEEENGDAAVEDAITVPKIPAGLQQEYIFMPSRVRDAYLLATVRTLLANGGRTDEEEERRQRLQKRHKKDRRNHKHIIQSDQNDGDDDNPEAFKAKSAIIFVATCERAALISGILEQVGVANVALHSLLSQPRRLAALAKFQSEQVRILVATDVASRGLDIPFTDLVINCELPRNPVNYVHRVGRTARAGRRGRAVSLVSEHDIALVHASEKASGRELLKNKEVTDDIAVTMLGTATKASRLAKLKLQDIGFDELVQKFKERKARDRKERQRIEKALRKQEKAAR